MEDKHKKIIADYELRLKELESKLATATEKNQIAQVKLDFFYVYFYQKSISVPQILPSSVEEVKVDVNQKNQVKIRLFSFS